MRISNGLAIISSIMFAYNCIYRKDAYKVFDRFSVLENVSF